jgi:hypothetical protein
MMFRINLTIAFLVVMAASSWLTLQALDYLDSPRARVASAGGGSIAIVEASYGLSCKDFQVQAPRENLVRVGNATAAVAKACDSKSGTCRYAVNVANLGDPAGGCGKDFQVKWRCGPEGARTHEARLAAEAHGRSLSISCPAR